MAALAELAGPSATTPSGALQVIRRQARCRCRRARGRRRSPPFERVARRPDRIDAAFGSTRFPKPDYGDVFVDYEGHPFWHPTRGLFFLFGLLTKTRRRRDGSTTRGGPTTSTPRKPSRTRALIDYLAAAALPTRACTSTTTTTPSARRCERLAADHGVGEITLERPGRDRGVRRPAAGRPARRAGRCRVLRLKALERLTDYERGHDIDQGGGAVVEYERYMASAARGAEPDRRVQRGRRARDLGAARLAGRTPPRRPGGGLRCLRPEEPDRARRADRRAPHVRSGHRPAPAGRPARLLAPRGSASSAPTPIALSIADEADQFDSLSAITRLSFQGLETALGAGGRSSRGDGRGSRSRRNRSASTSSRRRR